MGANAQTSVPTFTAGDVLTAANMNISAATGVPVFATTTTRDAAFGGTGEKTLAEGQMCYIEAAPKRFQVYNGTVWIDYDTAYTSFTPTWTGLTLGNGTQNFRYVRLGKFVHIVGQLTFGSTTAVTGNVYFNDPVTSNQPSVTVTGTAWLVDSGGGNVVGIVLQGSGIQIIQTTNVAGTYPGNTAFTATVPFTWSVNDQINVNIVYEAV